MLLLQQSGLDPKLAALISPKVGLIRQLDRPWRGVGEPNPPVVYQALLSHFDFREGKINERGAAGKGRTDLEAMTAAIGEAVERYCAYHVDTTLVTRARAEELAGSVITPEECVLYSESQYNTPDFAWARWSAGQELAWIRMRELPGGQDVFAPAHLVYMGLTPDDPAENLCPSTSNGLAAGPSVDFALLRGLLELVERDHFVITWLNRVQAPEVTFTGAPSLASSIIEHYARFKVQARVFSLKLDLPVHVMMAVALLKEGDGPAAVVGLGSDLDPAKAAEKALFEVCQVRPGECRRYIDDPPAARLTRYQDVRKLEDHSGYFAIREHLNELGFLLERGRKVELAALENHATESLASDLAQTVAATRKAGCRVAYKELTTQDVRTSGLHVVRVLCPGLQPIHFGHGEARLGGERLFDVPMRLGIASRHVREEELNPCPHPLA